MIRARPRLALAAALLAGTPLLGGCIAAVAVPIAAAGAITKKRLNGQDERRAERGTGTSSGTGAGIDPMSAAAVPAGQSLPGKTPTPVPAPPPAAPSAPAPGMQYLYGSGEAAALSLQAYQLLWTYLAARAADRKNGVEVKSVVLAPDATLDAPKFMPCGKKPLAVVLDIDETVVLNLGYENDAARRVGDYDDARWKRWEATGADKIAAVPGAIETLDAARRAGISVVFNSNRSEANAGGTIAALAIAGLGAAEPGKTLWLRAEGPGTSGKDGRRAEIAAKYCVVALVGDQLGDFSDLFNPGGVPVPIRRSMAMNTLIASMWGAGWFILPNPVYGTGLHGGFDEVFPADKQWTDPADPVASPPAPEVAPTPEPAPASAPTPQ